MTILTVEQAQAFITKSNAQLAIIKDAFAGLVTIPHLSRAIFDYPREDLKEVLAKKYECARYTLWADTYLSKVTTNVLAYNQMKITDIFNLEINADNISNVEALAANQVDNAELLNNWLNSIGANKFSTTMRIADKTGPYNIKALTGDVLYLAGVLTGVSVGIDDMQNTVNHVNLMSSYRQIDSLGVEIEMAKNKNLTIRLPKATVEALNKAIA